MAWNTWRTLLLIGITLFLSAQTRFAFAQEPFFKGKTIRLIVGLAPGGGFDTYSRIIARHMGKHITGNPTILVDNMPGAASLVAANYAYKAAKPDGLTMVNFVGGLALQQLLGRPGIEFQATNFEYLGVPGQDNFMIGLSKSTGITSVEQWRSTGTLVKIGGVAPGGGTDDIPLVLKATLGLPLQLVTGYKGTGPVRLAFNAGEVQGICNSWESFKSTWRNELETGQVVIVLQGTVRSHPELPNIPNAYDLAKTEEAKKLIRTLAVVNGPTNRPYAFPPGTPKDRVKIVRKAFTDTMKDPEFLAETKKANLDIAALDGEEIEQYVREIFKLEPSLVEKLKEILK